MGPSGNPLLRFPSLCAGGPNHTIHVVFCKHFPAAVQFDQIWCPHARWERFLGIEYLDDSTNLPLPAIALHAVAYGKAQAHCVRLVELDRRHAQGFR